MEVESEGFSELLPQAEQLTADMDIDCDFWLLFQVAVVDLLTRWRLRVRDSVSCCRRPSS